ncbi:hypothetical protein Ahy_A05g021800 isoform B [Arachis hypogaea]|uniref:Uncharacterized protein n=1 Tax=Arachis hypogaea TaxID=3818 RepID=A0A445CYC8_ARAHY|nr:hypothetical protein Ahy_A05g021800 isoform B [Arachis hypogaea]
MLLAVEGGGFFSSSASGYSKGLSLLLLGQRSDDKSRTVLPWNQYQLVDQESEPELQLASKKNRLSRGCASFVCFGRASAGLDTPSHLKVGPAQQHNVSPGPLVPDDGTDPSANVDNDNRKVALKSSLRRPQNHKPDPLETANEHEALGGKGSDAPDQTEGRKVQWTDVCGSELVEIREFEPSEVDGSIDEYDDGNERTCSCAIIQNPMVDGEVSIKDIVGQFQVVKTLTQLHLTGTTFNLKLGHTLSTHLPCFLILITPHHNVQTKLNTRN